MFKLISAECRKIKWLVVISLILLDVVVSFMLAAGSVATQGEFFPPNWMTLYFQAIFYHGVFFLPLYTGIFAAFLSFYEHHQGAWKQMLTLPFPRWKVFISKYLTLIILVGLTQLAFLIAYLVTGYWVQVEGAIPLHMILIHILGGWLASFPLAMLQLSLSLRFKSFGMSLLFGILMVIPNIIIVGLTSVLGTWFPTAPPYYAMFPQGLAMSPRLDIAPFIVIIFVTFMIYFVMGCRSFVRRDWL